MYVHRLPDAYMGHISFTFAILLLHLKNNNQLLFIIDFKTHTCFLSFVPFTLATTKILHYKKKLNLKNQAEYDS